MSRKRNTIYKITYEDNGKIHVLLDYKIRYLVSKFTEMKRKNKIYEIDFTNAKIEKLTLDENIVDY